VKILYLDPFSGVSGDMFVGALIDLGLDLAKLHHELSKLNLSGYHLSTKRVMRGAMAATKFDVDIGGHIDGAFDADPSAPLSQDHGHSHGHLHEHGHEHSHSHGGTVEKAQPSQQRRTFAEIRTLIQESGLSARVKESSVRCFSTLAAAEGRIHNMPPDEVHFHEVGAIDSIVDTVGACIGIELLGIEQVWCGAVALGSGGMVKCDHGLMPVPTPATLEIMKGIAVRQTPIEKELTTPTGAALVAGLVSKFGSLPAMQIEKIGYGAGSREKQAIPNILRVLMGSVEDSTASTETHATTDTVIEVRANIDDLSPEILGYVSEKLLVSGALDVFFTPIQMKKNRPATMLTVISEPHLLDTIAGILFQETTSFGLRYQTQSRLKLSRRIVLVKTVHGEVRVKLGEWKGKIVSVHPEYDDCRALAERTGVPLREIIDAARIIARKIKS
jgi:pyridinium-3,5-bisthiocarboxylic acid mononucleotide nickel chelatase